MWLISHRSRQLIKGAADEQAKSNSTGTEGLNRSESLPATDSSG